MDGWIDPGGWTSGMPLPLVHAVGCAPISQMDPQPPTPGATALPALGHGLVNPKFPTSCCFVPPLGALGGQYWV